MVLSIHGNRATKCYKRQRTRWLACRKYAFAYATIVFFFFFFESRRHEKHLSVLLPLIIRNYYVGQTFSGTSHRRSLPSPAHSSPRRSPITHTYYSFFSSVIYPGVCSGTSCGRQQRPAEGRCRERAGLCTAADWEKKAGFRAYWIWRQRSKRKATQGGRWIKRCKGSFEQASGWSFKVGGAP